MPMLDTLIGQLAKDLTMEEAITETEEHHYHLPFDNGNDIEAAEINKSCLLKGTIGGRPEKNAESFLLKVMEANLFGVGTRGAVIGLKEDGKQLTLSLEVDYTISYKDFKEKLEDFISVMDFWRNEALKHE